MSGTKIWIGEMECGLCCTYHSMTIEIEKDLQEPIIPVECPNCGAISCVPDYDENNEEEWYKRRN